MEILLPVIIVAVIGFIAAIGLALASKFMEVPVDEKQQKLCDALPGANCGACGYSGCEGYAAALATGEAEPDKCAPGGEKAAATISEILGVEVVTQNNVAHVGCSLGCVTTKEKYNYIGIESCSAASLLHSGPMECSFACIGLGDCVKACSFDAIKMINGKPNVCEDICVGCGLCAGVCPKSIISITPKERKVSVQCSNKDKGPAVVKACTVSCIGCRMCEKQCETGAIKVIDNLAVVDYSLCNGCGKCKEVCKRKVLI